MPTKLPLVLALAVVVVSAPSSAQFVRPEPRGLVGTATLGATSVSLDDAPAAWRSLFGLRVAGRFALTNRFRIGPEVSLQFTNLRGMKVGRDPYAFFQGDAGVEASVRVHEHLRLVGHGRVGLRSVELFESANIWNYYGSGKTFGLGVDIPITCAGRGITLEVNRIDGHFDTKELRAVKQAADKNVAAWTIIIGWGGPLTIGPFWK